MTSGYFPRRLHVVVSLASQYLHPCANSATFITAQRVVSSLRSLHDLRTIYANVDSVLYLDSVISPAIMAILDDLEVIIFVRGKARKEYPIYGDEVEKANTITKYIQVVGGQCFVIKVSVILSVT